MRFFTFLLAITSTTASAQSTVTSNPTATIKNGVIMGTTTMLPSATAPVNRYLGIPYQKTPPERFAPPSPVTSWQSPRNALSFGPACIQQYITDSSLSAFASTLMPNVTESEDCLYLNVWQPNGSPPDGGWPIMFWLYGGALQFGSADQQYYNGASFASFEDVILVSINYRVNVFGFPAGAGLPVNATNLGFLDQRYALQWVQDNIASFSGNPEKVTIFGESAGAFSVDALLTVPPNPLPFRAAILESGTGIGETLSTLETNNNASWQALVAGVNCSSSTDVLSCVRAVPATTIKNFIQINATTFAPIVDNLTFTTNVTISRTSGRAAKVPLLLGTNANEGTLFTYGQTNLTAYVDSLFAFISFEIPQILQQYAVGTPGITSQFDAIALIFGDLVFQCAAGVVANQSTAAGNPTWRYYFNSTFPNTAPLPALGVYHSSEIPLVFGTYPTANATAQEYSLSQYMRGAWARFARNPAAGPGWNPVGSYAGLDLGVLGGLESAGVTMVSAQTVDSRCDLFTGLYTFLTT